MRFAHRLGIPEATPRFAQLAILFYLAHLLCEGWIGTSQGFLALSACAAILALIRRELRIRYHPLYVPLGLFAVASTISALLSFRPAFSLLEVSEWFTFLTFPLALTLLRSVPRTIRLALICLLILGLFQGSYGLGQYYFLDRRELENRITGTAAHVMTYSGLLLPVSLIALLLVLRPVRLAPLAQGRPVRLASLAQGSALVISCAFTTSLALLLTFTRGAWIGWLAGFVTILALRRSRWLAYSVPVLILAITLSPLPLFGRFISSFDLGQSSNLDRIRMAQAGIEIIKDYPFFGVGPSNIKEIYPLYREPDAPRFRIPHLHNNFIQIWAERGMLALAAYLLLMGGFIGICLSFIRNRGTTETFFAEAGTAVAAGLFFAGLFEFNFGDSEVLVLMLDVFALVCAALELRNDPGLGTVLP